MRQDRHGDLERGTSFLGAHGVQRQRILRRKRPGLGEEGDKPQRLPSRDLGNLCHAAGEQRGIAAELVHEKADDHLSVVRVEHRLGADEAGDDAAAVNVASEVDRQIGR